MRAALVLLLLLLTSAVTARQRAVRQPSIPPLDQRTLESLWFGDRHAIALRPGQEQVLQLGITECCVYFRRVRARVAWSIDPANRGASIDSNGVVRIDPNARDGAVYRVYADVENGRRFVSTDVYVYTAEGNPLAAGVWRHYGEISCDGGFVLPLAAEDPDEILELDLMANGQFRVTWLPFEVYVDFWGPYTYDLATKRITFGVTHGNYVPAEMDRDGTFELVKLGEPEVLNGWTVQNYELLLNSVWLGRRRQSTRPPGCGMVFRGNVDLAPAAGQ